MLNLWSVIKGLLVQNENDRTKELSIEVDSTATTGTRTTLKSSQSANRTVNIPDADDTLVGRDTTDTLTNKSIGDSNSIQAQSDAFEVQDAADSSKKLDIDLSSAATSSKVTVRSDHTADRTLILPDASDNLVSEEFTQTLTNKTIDADSNTISNIDNADIKAGAAIDATKIHNGSVDNTEFSHLDGVTSNIQTQIDGKQDAFAGLVDNAVLKGDGTSSVQASGISVDDLNNMTGVNDITAGGNVVVTGDLTVNGTTTSINTTDLDVADANITINNNGNDVSAEGAGITVERAGTDGSLVYEDALASKFKVGASGSEVEVADVSSSQTVTNKNLKSSTNLITGASADSLTRETGNQNAVNIPDASTSDDFVLAAHGQVITNKDIDGGTASNSNRITIPQDTKSNLDSLTRKEGTVVYANDQNALYIDDGSSLVELSSLSFTAPTVQRFTSGSGTYNTPVGVRYIRVRMVGGGGGGAGGGASSTGGAGGAGSNTTFGTSLLTANGAGAAAAASAVGGPGGSFTVNAPAVNINSHIGSNGIGFTATGSTASFITGSTGGMSPFMGAGVGVVNQPGQAARANSGSGGGGGGATSIANGWGGTGGGAGGYVDAFISSPAATYSYSVGSGGSAGTNGTSGGPGGAGGSGIIIVEEYY